VAKLTNGLPALDAEIQSLIEARRAAYPKTKGDAAAGQKVFEQSCAACHSIDGKGGMTGPQLDGIGNRGLDRLLEDVLDPNRSVDPAFHAWTIKLKDGTDLSALVRREEGQTLVLADPTGKEVSVPLAQVVSRKESNLSLMPTNFGEIISMNDFHNLMAYLLSKNAVGKQ
jgi:putative heme-binding domain-containing protein